MNSSLLVLTDTEPPLRPSCHPHTHLYPQVSAGTILIDLKLPAELLPACPSGVDSTHNISSPGNSHRGGASLETISFPATGSENLLLGAPGLLGECGDYSFP